MSVMTMPPTGFSLTLILFESKQLVVVPTCSHKLGSRLSSLSMHT